MLASHLAGCAYQYSGSTLTCSGSWWHLQLHLYNYIPSQSHPAHSHLSFLSSAVPVSRGPSPLSHSLLPIKYPSSEPCGMMECPPHRRFFKIITATEFVEKIDLSLFGLEIKHSFVICRSIYFDLCHFIWQLGKKLYHHTPALSCAEDYCIMTWTFLWSLGRGYWQIDIPWSAQTRLNFGPNTEVTAFEGNTQNNRICCSVGLESRIAFINFWQFKRRETWVSQVHAAVFVCWCLETSLSHCSSWSPWLLEPRVLSFWQMSEHQQLCEDNERHPVMWHGKNIFLLF